jgi:hypothetical protein
MANIVSNRSIDASWGLATVHATKIDARPYPNSPRDAQRLSLHHEICQSTTLVSHWAHLRMWLRLKLNVLLRAFRVNTDLKTASPYVAKGSYGQMDVQKLPCCLLDLYNLERRIPNTVSGQNIKHGMIIGMGYRCT